MKLGLTTVDWSSTTKKDSGHWTKFSSFNILSSHLLNLLSFCFFGYSSVHWIVWFIFGSFILIGMSTSYTPGLPIVIFLAGFLRFS